MRKPCKICYSEQAEKDMQNICEFIHFEILPPDTVVGLLDTIYKLKTTGKLFAYSQDDFLLSNYGEDVRTTDYKKMTIVYKVIGKNVVILRVMAGSLIK